METPSSGTYRVANSQFPWRSALSTSLWPAAIASLALAVFFQPPDEAPFFTFANRIV